MGVSLSRVQELRKLLPRFGSMRRKIANVVEGCWYNLLKVVPGNCSKYSESEFALAAISKR